MAIGGGGIGEGSMAGDCDGGKTAIHSFGGGGRLRMGRLRSGDVYWGNCNRIEEGECAFVGVAVEL